MPLATPEFADRLDAAISNGPDAPTWCHGRVSWPAGRMTDAWSKVSVDAVDAWAVGASLSRR